MSHYAAHQPYLFSLREIREVGRRRKTEEERGRNRRKKQEERGTEIQKEISSDRKRGR